MLPDSLIARRALELVTGHSTMPVEAVVQRALGNQLRLCIKKIGDREMSWSKLRGKLLDRKLGPKEQHLVRKLFSHLTDPTERELRYLRDSLIIESDEGSWAWRGKILVGDDLDEWLDANEAVAEAEVLLEEAEEEEVEESERVLEEAMDRLAKAEEAALEVVGTMPNTNVMQRAIEQVPAEARRKPALQRKESSENLIRLCVTEIDGQRVGYSALKGTGVDDWLHPKEQALIIHALMELGTPDDEEEADFLSTVQEG